jgi:hypothetical protein
MAWPSKNPDDYVAGNGRSGSGLTPEDEAKRVPARYPLLGGLAGLVLSLPLALTQHDGFTLAILFMLAGELVAQLWWRFRVNPAVAVGVIALGGAIGAGVDALVGHDLRFAIEAGAWFALIGLCVLVQVRARRHPVELRPQPGPLVLPGLGSVEPSKNPDDYR